MFRFFFYVGQESREFRPNSYCRPQRNVWCREDNNDDPKTIEKAINVQFVDRKQKKELQPLFEDLRNYVQNSPLSRVRFIIFLKQTLILNI